MYDIALWAVGFASGIACGVLIEWLTQPRKEKKP